MATKTFIIAGGGISGLTLRYYLSKKFPSLRIELYEQKSLLGGCIQTHSSPNLFEQGPRTFKVSRSKSLLKLINDLGLSDEMIYSDPSANRRYIYKDNKLNKVSLFSPIFLKCIPALFKEWSVSPGPDQETIDHFARRRFSPFVATTLIDPLVKGIFGGSSCTLSVSACFPQLKKMEKDYGSITAGLLKTYSGNQERGLFTLKNGAYSLIKALKEQGRGPIYTSKALNHIPKSQKIFLALPKNGLQSLFSHDLKMFNLLKKIKSVDLNVVNLYYNRPCLNYKGFGYLVPSFEKQKIMGVVFDSSIFPQQNTLKKETRLSVMLSQGGVFEAIEGVKKHLKIKDYPLSAHYTQWQGSIPQYELGHEKIVAELKCLLQTNYPNVEVTGNFLRGVSVDQCIEICKNTVDKTLHS